MPEHKQAEEAPQVFWCVLLERTLYAEAVDALLGVAGECSYRGYAQIHVPYMRTDDARNQITRIFLDESKGPNDVLVMLDNDHIHPHDIVARLSARPEGVVGALAFRRGGKHDPLWFVRDEAGHIQQPAEWDEGTVYSCEAVGTGAIAIKRWVFDMLMENGHEWPFFRYEYISTPPYSPTEDIYFARICEQSGIKHHVHTGVEIPHIKLSTVDHATWKAVLTEVKEL